ncbi:F-box/WD repeat-containing protein 7-like isoform X2 [Varroa jacobsoni]|uniref:F-box/WD repeat-containing protein 7-like isoform X2 n=1 Tax=Varroa jacobsoni TaxID=62625 RepID=UPI000BF51DD6|nr:F-box/WD repeat-containing protein 7-like isoform X2 [Varroa jacobsoni]
MDINSARVEELSSLTTVGRELAEAIVRARTVKQQSFRRLEDLISVTGITEDFIEVNRAHLICRTPAVSALSTRPCSSESALALLGSANTSPPISHGTRGQGDLLKGNPDGDEVTSLASSVDRLLTSRIASDDDSQREDHSVPGDHIQTASQHKNHRLPSTTSAAMEDADSSSNKPSTSLSSPSCLSSNLPSGGGAAAFSNSGTAHVYTCRSTITSSANSNHTISNSTELSPLQPVQQQGSADDSSNGTILPPPKRKSDNLAIQQAHPPASKKVCVVRGRELETWLNQFDSWSHGERLNALDCLMASCTASQVRHVMRVIEPQFQRDFISLLPRELALHVLGFLEPRDLLRAAQTCHAWRVLAEDNILWRAKCREQGIESLPQGIPTVSNTWKRAFMRLHAIELNWRSRRLRSPKSLKGHDDHVVTCLQFAGNRIVSGSDDNTLKVWDATTGQCLRVLIGHTGGVWSSQMSASTVISGSTDRTLRVWNSETGECTHVLYGHTSTVRCMHLHGDRVVSGSRDATLRLWDITTGACLGVFVGHVAAVRCVQFNGRLIVSGAYDYMVKVWQPGREECLHTLQGHTNRVYSLQFDGTHVVSGSLDTSIRVWDVETGECKHSLTGHQSLTSGMELRDNILVSGNADSTVKVWDITTGQCLQTLAGPSKHQSAVTCLQFNSKFVITSSDDGTVKLWDLKTGEFIRDLVCLKSGGSGGVVWRIRADQTKLVAAVGSRNGTEETQLLVLDFDAEEPPMSGLIENMSDDCSSATQTASEPGPSGISAIGQLAQQQASWEF